MRPHFASSRPQHGGPVDTEDLDATCYPAQLGKDSLRGRAELSDDGIIYLNGARFDRRQLFIAADSSECKKMALRPHNKS